MERNKRNHLTKLFLIVLALIFIPTVYANLDYTTGTYTVEGMTVFSGSSPDNLKDGVETASIGDGLYSSDATSGDNITVTFNDTYDLYGFDIWDISDGTGGTISFDYELFFGTTSIGSWHFDGTNNGYHRDLNHTTSVSASYAKIVLANYSGGVGFLFGEWRIRDNEPEGPPTPNASDHLTETLTKQKQTNNVTLNSVVYTTIYSYSFTPTYNDTNFYQSFTIPVNPTASNTLTCKAQIDGVDLGQEHSRTNTAGEIGQILLKTTNTTIDATSHTINLLCKRTGGGSMELFDIVGTGHLLKDIGSGTTVPYKSYTFTNSSTGNVIIETDTYTSYINESVDPMDSHLILEYTGTITNNGGAETIQLIPTIEDYTCSPTLRYVGGGGSGSVGGNCILKNITNNTAYTIYFNGTGTNADYSFTYDIKEIHVEDWAINSTSVNWTKGAETGDTTISTLNVDQDLSNGQDLYAGAGISTYGTSGTGSFYLALGGDATANSTEFKRETGTTYGVLGVHNVFNNTNTGNYTISLKANVDTITNIVTEFITYEAGKQVTTINEQGFIAKDLFYNTTINTFSIEVNNNTYSTTTGSITLPSTGLENLTWSATNYNTITYNNVNTSEANYFGYLCQVYVSVQTAQDIQENNYAYPYNITINGTTVHTTSATDYSCMPLNLAKNITLSTTNTWNKTLEKTYTTSGIENITFYNISNAWLKFYGSLSNTEYTPSCSYASTTWERDQTNYYSVTNNATFECLEGTYYSAFNTTINTSTYPVNQSIPITEYTVTLNFSANTTGNVVWSGSTNGQYPLESDEGYNITSFKWIKLTKNFTDGDYIIVRFNNQSNNTNQYYEWIADTDVVIQENINVLTTLDMFIRFKVFNFAEEELYGATINLKHCEDSTGTNCSSVNQRITQPITGTAHDGTAFSIDDSLYYWATITKEGYETKNVIFNAQDLDNNFLFEVRLNQIAYTPTESYRINCPESHQNSSVIICSISGTSGTIAWGTDTNGLQTTLTLQNGGGTITLTKGTDYTDGTNETLTIYTPDGSGNWIAEKTKMIEYLAIPIVTLYIDEDEATNLATVLLWIAIVLISSIVGLSIRKDEIDTGYYAFAGALLIISIFYPTLMVVSAIIILTGIGNLLFSTTRE